jgi:hypothetical protein
MERGDVERLFQVLVVEQVLHEKCVTNALGFTSGTVSYFFKKKRS